MSAFSGVRRVPARRVRPSLRDPRFAFLIVGQSVNSVVTQPVEDGSSVS